MLVCRNGLIFKIDETYLENGKWVARLTWLVFDNTLPCPYFIQCAAHMGGQWCVCWLSENVSGN